MILKETIDNVLALDIVDVIGAYVSLKKAGSNYKGLSPFTSENTPSFMVSPSKRIFKCFSSGRGGNVVKFIMENEHISFPEAIRYLAEKYQIPILETAKTEEDQITELQKLNLYVLTKFANEYYQNVLKTTPEAIKYLKEERKFTDEIIKKFEIGFAPGTISTLTTLIINNGYNWTTALEASLINYKEGKLYDRFKNRIMFPIKTNTGNIAGFGGRYIGTNSNFPKYLNSSDSLIYNKSKILYGLFESKKAIVENDEALLVEGYSDVIMFHIKGIQNIVSSCGTAFNEEHAKLIKRYAKNVVVIFDGDDPGLLSTIRAIDVLLKEDLYVKVCVLPFNTDPDDFAKNKTKEEIVDYINFNKKDFISFKFDFLSKKFGEDFSSKTDAIVETLNSISLIKNPITADLYLKELSKMSETNINSLRDMLHQNKAIPSESYEIDLVEVSKYSSIKDSFLKDQCERKIIQFLLAYPNLKMIFKDVFYTEKGILKTNIETTVKERIFKMLSSDEIEIENPLYFQIYNVIYSCDDFIKNKSNIDPELYENAQRIFEEEIIGNKTIFDNILDSKISFEFKQQIENSLSRSIDETLLYYKIFFIKNLIEEEMLKQKPDFSQVTLYLEFQHSISEFLNLL